MDYEVKHNLADNRFEASSGLLVIGVIDYYRENNVLIVTHTKVQSEYEGLGIAAALTKKLLIYIAENNLKVTPVCPYTKAYIDRHPEFRDLIQRDL